jgi:DNA-binding transcriptional LysR family regulator
MPLPRALVLPAAITAFVDGAPRAVVNVVEGSWRDLVEPLRDGVIDLMVGALRDDPPPGLEQRPLFTDRLVIVARAGHPLAAAETVDTATLARFGWIVAAPGTPLRAQWEALFAPGALPPAPIECGSVMVIRGILAGSDLLTLLSPDQVSLELSAGVFATVGAPLAQGVRSVGITMREGWRPTPAQARFVSLLESAANRTRLPKIE